MVMVLVIFIVPISIKPEIDKDRKSPTDLGNKKETFDF